MKPKIFFTLAAGALALANFTAHAEDGFQSIFNGKDLTGWAGRPQHWSVEDGAITGITTKETPAQGNNFLIARDGEKDLIVGDFELRCSFKFTGDWGNSGIQYRSLALPNFVVNGYQADMETGPTYSGILYEEGTGRRGILAQRGQKVVIKDDPANPGKPKIEVTGSLGDAKEIGAAIDPRKWNDYVVIAQGNHLQHFINGHQTVDVVDEQESKAAKSGILALQLHGGQPMKIQFKNLQLKSTALKKSIVAGLDRLQGVWMATQMTARGEKVDTDAVAKLKLTIEKDTYHVESPEFSDQGTFSVSETASPKTMDVVTANGDRLAAIYEISGDTMKVCYATGGGSRPTNFAGDGADQVVTVYKRQKN